MHQHPLFQHVTVECECCKIPREIWFTSHDDAVICKGCRKHYQGERAWRMREHVGLYHSELLLSLEEREYELRASKAARQALEDEYNQKIEHMEAELNKQRVEIFDLRAAVRDGEPNPAVQKWLADEEVRGALDKRDRAYRARDFVFAALWRLARLHRPDEHDEHMCTCKRPASKCRELEAVASVLHALDDWEDKQTERLRDGLEHGLPHDHPEVMGLRGAHLRRGYTG